MQHKARHMAHCVLCHCKSMLATMNELATPTELNSTDTQYMRMANQWAKTARERGNRPFGAVVVSSTGEVLTDAYCNTTETGDCTGHAETNAVRQLSPKASRDVLATSTLYSSAEPCVMCAGAIFWSGIGRVVFGIDAVRLRVFRGEVAEQKDAELSCRDVFDASPRTIECIGPVMLDECSEPHIGFWKK